MATPREGGLHRTRHTAAAASLDARGVADPAAGAVRQRSAFCFGYLGACFCLFLDTSELADGASEGHMNTRRRPRPSRRPPLRLGTSPPALAVGMPRRVDRFKKMDPRGDRSAAVGRVVHGEVRALRHVPCRPPSPRSFFLSTSGACRRPI